jgi:SPP1 family predicted phage head-tail adaptor
MKLGDRTTNPGELRVPVTVQNPTVSQGSGGAQSTTWSTVGTLFARWKNAHGPETVTSDALKTVKRASVRIRYLSTVTEKSAILKDGERWQVISIDDINERHEYMELVVELAKATV